MPSSPDDEAGQSLEAVLPSLTQEMRNGRTSSGETVTQDPCDYGEAGPVFVFRGRYTFRSTDSSCVISVRSLRFSRTVRRRASISLRNLPRSLVT